MGEGETTTSEEIIDQSNIRRNRNDQKNQYLIKENFFVTGRYHPYTAKQQVLKQSNQSMLIPSKSILPNKLARIMTNAGNFPLSPMTVLSFFVW